MNDNDRLGASEPRSMGEGLLRRPEAPTPRRRLLFWTSAAGVALTGVIVVLVNVLSGWLSLRLDLTQGRIYSLSPSSRSLVRQIEEPVLIKAFVSPGLPAGMVPIERYVRDLLSEYRLASRRRIKLEFVVPYPPEQFERKAMTAGLQPIQIEERGRSQYSAQRAFLGLALYHRDRVETVPLVADIAGLEYELTSRLAKMIDRPRKALALTSGHGEISLRDPAKALTRDLERFYDLRDWPLPVASSTTPAAEAILIAGPRQKFDEASLRAIDQALMSGKRLGFLLDSYQFDAAHFGVMPQDPGLRALLAHYGVELGDRLVLDAQAESVGITQNVMGMALTSRVEYPYIPVITDFNSAHPALRGLRSLGLPFPTRVEASSAAVAGVRFVPLLYTSRRSWLASPSVYSVAPDRIAGPRVGDATGPFSVGGVAQGSFTSFFANAPQRTSPETLIFVVGTAQFSNPALPEFSGASAFLTNLLGYLAQDETLIGIRSRGEILRPLRRDLDDMLRLVAEAVAILAPPLLAVAWGVFQWRRRRRWRRTAAWRVETPA